MPELNGYGRALGLRSPPEYGSVRMGAVTGFAMYDERDCKFEAGFDAHLSKALAPADLTRAVMDIVH